MIGTGNSDTISRVINSFTQQNQDLIKMLIQIQYYFRGSLTRDDIWAMSPAERDLAIEFLNDRMKDAGEMIKKQIPVFI